MSVSTPDTRGRTSAAPNLPPNRAPADAAAAFGARMMDALNGGALMLMTSIGHRTGLFDVMRGAGHIAPATLAAEAGLSERYVREWLGAMLCGGVVGHDPGAGTYYLPAEHAACLTRAAAPNNFAVMAQWVGVLGAAEDQVVDAFGHGRGVPYSAYRRFHQVMAEDGGQRVVSGLVKHALPLVPGLAARLEAGIDVLDVGCGAGGAMVALAAAFRRSRFTGYDCSAEAVAAAGAEASRRGLRNVHFAARDAAEPFGHHSFDLVTAFDAIHDQVKPDRVLKNIADALRPAGTFLMVDVRASSHHHHNVGHPVGPFLYAMSCIHCVSVSLAGGGPGLGAAWGEEKATDMLREAGFTDVHVARPEHDPFNNYYTATRTGG